MISKYGIQVKNIVKDFSLCPRDPINFFNDIYLQTKDLDISLVINNVGAGAGYMALADTPVHHIYNLIALNIFPICFMSRLFLPKLLNRPQGGGLINLSSLAGYTAGRDLVQYCACKSFDWVLSEIISSEVSITKSIGKVDVLALLPAFVDTPLSHGVKGKSLEISRYECAEAALRCLGVVDITSAHWKHLIVLVLIPIVAFLR